MTKEEFVNSVFHLARVAESATMRSLKGPSGRTPPADAVRRSGWFLLLDAADRAMVSEVVREAIEMSVFTMLCCGSGSSGCGHESDADVH